MWLAERSRHGRVVILLIGVWIAASAVTHAMQSRELAVGHWVEVKGELDPDKTFVASAVEVLEPATQESVIGTAEEHSSGDKLFHVLGLEVEYSDKSDWLKITPDELEGTRVKVEGHWNGALGISARAIAVRPEGRSRLEARVDSIVHVVGGRELRMMGLRVFVADGVAIDSKQPLESYAFAPQKKPRDMTRVRDDDDYIPGTHHMGDQIAVGLRIEWNGRWEDNFDLHNAAPEDRVADQLALRGELTWTPAEDFYALFGFRGSLLWIDDEKNGWSSSERTFVAEAFGYARDVLTPGLDLQIGRQDFDEKREWLYKKNLDAARMIYSRDGLRAELSASTNYSDASEKDEHTDNLIAYVSNNDTDRTLAAYVVDRRDQRDPDSYPIHLGARALGEWLPESEVWAEYSLLRGYQGTTDLKSFGYDVGMTWEGKRIEPYYFTLGWAYGSGDDDPADGEDGTFRQTGLQRNNDKFGGVTSFRYYGEIIDPELSNLAILTVGVGRRIGRRNSIDLVWHQYVQPVASNSLVHSHLDRKPTGLDRELGQEIDLILGSRMYEALDLELILGTFLPGDAFAEDADAAWLVAMQVRYRL